MKFFALPSIALFSLVGFAGGAAVADPMDEFFPAEPDPFVGDYSGRWIGKVEVDPELHAQVIALGNDSYRIRFVPKLFLRTPQVDVVEAKAENGRLAFDGDSVRGEIVDGRIRGERTRGNDTFDLMKVTHASPTMGTEAPAGAKVLGKDAWQPADGWELGEDGLITVTPKGGYLTSKETFKDLEMHMEFRNSFMPRQRGQQRSNSGVFLQDVYEVQILDSYGLEGVYDECGALYKVMAPKVNACAPPAEWQTYDIVYRAPRYENDELVEDPRITVRHNGVLIHHEQVMPWITAWTEEERLAPPPKDAGHIKLQGHNNYVQFRNIWVKPVEKALE